MSAERARAGLTRVMIADDHALMRAGIRKILALDPMIEVVGEASTAQALLTALPGAALDVLALDLVMPGVKDMDLLHQVRLSCPALPILVLTMHDDPNIAREAFKRGVKGYLTKDSSPELLIDAVHRIAAGQSYLDPTLAPLMVEQVDRSNDALLDLSAREVEVLMALVKGRSITEIASDLKLASNTVSTYKMRLMEKLGQPTIADLTKFALRHGLIN